MLRILSVVALVSCLVALSVRAGQEQVTLKGKIRQSLEALLATESKGIENCQNKCDKAFNRFAYAISTGGNQETFEFRACVIGCERCQQDQTTANKTGVSNDDNCFNYCKNYDWSGQGILKGVIEPDKACLGGCIVQTW
jgi:hypothetical protein